jgi:hypothetical protein
MERLLERERETDRGRDRIDAFDRLLARLGDRLLESRFPSRPRDTERSPLTLSSVSILSLFALLPLAEDVMERGLGDRPRDDMLSPRCKSLRMSVDHIRLTWYP